MSTANAALAMALLALLVRVPFMPLRGFPEDQALFAAWAEISRDGSTLSPPGGLDRLYAPRADGSGKRWTNYPPGYLLVLRGVAAVYDLVSPAGEPLDVNVIRGIKFAADAPPVHRAIWVLKIPAVLADAAIAGLLCLWTARRTALQVGLIVGALYALAPPVIFDSAVWGQVESVFLLPLLLAVERARRGSVTAMAFWAALSVLVKAHAIMLAPLFAVVLFLRAGTDARLIGRAVAAAMAPVVLVLLPFGFAQAPAIWEVYARSTSYYPFVQLNGFSAWFIYNPIVQPNLEAMSSTYKPDASQVFGLVSAKSLGFILLIMTWALAAVRLWRTRGSDAAINWAVRLLSIAFFVVSTQMHERYLVPAVALWLWAFSADRTWWIGFVTITLVATANLLWAWPGHGDNGWTQFWHSLLRKDWIGQPAGVWCAMALAAVLISTVVNSPKELMARSTSAPH